MQKCVSAAFVVVTDAKPKKDPVEVEEPEIETDAVEETLPVKDVAKVDGKD